MVASTRTSSSRGRSARQGRRSNHVGAAVPVRMDVLPAPAADVELELVRLAEALVEVELDPVRRDVPERPLTRLAGRLEEDQWAAAAARPLGPYVQLSAPVLHELDGLRRGSHTHVANGTS